MNKIKIIAEFGSCHMEKEEYVMEAIILCKEIGIDIFKLQLFKGNEHGNVELPRDWVGWIVEYCNELQIEPCFSVFDKDAVDLLVKHGCKKVKLSYDNAFNLDLVNYIRKFDFEIIASGSDNSYPGYADIVLLRPAGYPVKKVNREFELDAYDGLSSHYVGWRADLAFLRYRLKETGNTYIEKHFTLDHDNIDVPDSKFALRPKQLRRWVKEIRRLEN